MDIKKKIDEKFIKTGISRIDDGDLDVVIRNNKKISEKISNSNFLKKYGELGKVMFGMIRDYKNGQYRSIPWFTLGAIGFSMLYILNPFDIVPDFIPGLGYLDDFAVFTFALRFIETDLHEYLDWKINQKSRSMK